MAKHCESLDGHIYEMILSGNRQIRLVNLVYMYKSGTIYSIYLYTSVCVFTQKHRHTDKRVTNLTVMHFSIADPIKLAKMPNLFFALPAQYILPKILTEGIKFLLQNPQV